MIRITVARALLAACFVPMLALFVSARLETRARTGVPADGDELARRVIERNNCGSCHTLQAGGLDLRGAIGPDLTRAGARGRSARWLRSHLDNPSSIPADEILPDYRDRRHVMPSFSRLSEAEREAVVRFLMSLR